MSLRTVCRRNCNRSRHAMGSDMKFLPDKTDRSCDTVSSDRQLFEEIMKKLSRCVV